MFESPERDSALILPVCADFYSNFSKRKPAHKLSIKLIEKNWRLILINSLEISLLCFQISVLPLKKIKTRTKQKTSKQ